MVDDTIILLIKIILFLFLTIIIFGFYPLYYDVKLFSYLRKNQLKKFQYLWGNRGENPISITLRNWRYRLSNVDEEDEIIRCYKKKIRTSLKIMLLLLTLLTILITILLVTTSSLS